MNKLLFLLLIPFLNLYSQDIDYDNERFELVAQSMLLDKMSGNLYTNNLFAGVKSWEYSNNQNYIDKVRLNCDKTWCLLVTIGDETSYLKPTYDALYDEMYGLILIDNRTGYQFVSNFLGYRITDSKIQNILKEKGGYSGLPVAFKALLDCEEGYWCRAK